MKLKSLSIALATLGMGLAAASAQALVLLPGSGPLAVDIIGAAPGGTLLAQRSETVTTPHWSGTFRTAVVDGPEAGVNLDFYYQISNASSSTDALARLTGSDFPSGFTTNLQQTNAAVSLTGAGSIGSIAFVAGQQTAASGDRGTIGTVGFNFFPGTSGTGKIDPGESSSILIIRTNATTFGSGFTGIINGTATTVTSFMPTGQPPIVGPIPEPGTLALLASGLLAAGGVARRRTK
ncbi:MAG: PEP-CTERM sorting domain-containing protein [Methanocella sp.]